MKTSPRAVLCLLATLLPSLACAQDEATVAAWNIAAGRNGDAPGEIKPGRQDRIAEVIATHLKPDIIFLSEVFPHDSMGPAIAAKATALKWPLVSEVMPLQGQGVVQHFAILRRPDVSVTELKNIDGSDVPGEATSRKAVMAKVMIGKFDFVLIGVHLKSSRGKADRNKRTEQCKVLATEIDKYASAASGEKDVLVVGDYNMIPVGGTHSISEEKDRDSDNFTALNPTGFLTFPSNGLTRASHLSYFSGDIGKGNLLDGYAISAKHTTEYVPDSLAMPTHIDLKRQKDAFITPKKDQDLDDLYVSDHLPLKARFKITGDDD